MSAVLYSSAAIDEQAVSLLLLKAKRTPEDHLQAVYVSLYSRGVDVDQGLEGASILQKLYRPMHRQSRSGV